VTTNQLFFALATMNISLFGLAMAFFKYYIDAKIDPVAESVRSLVNYMILHEGKISRLEERTKNL
jgi:hypothetical protein